MSDLLIHEARVYLRPGEGAWLAGMYERGVGVDVEDELREIVGMERALDAADEDELRGDVTSGWFEDWFGALKSECEWENDRRVCQKTFGACTELEEGGELETRVIDLLCELHACRASRGDSARDRFLSFPQVWKLPTIARGRIAWLAEEGFLTGVYLRAEEADDFFSLWESGGCNYLEVMRFFGRERVFSFPKTTLKRMVEEFGDEPEDWEKLLGPGTPVPAIAAE